MEELEDPNEGVLCIPAVSRLSLDGHRTIELTLLSSVVLNRAET